MNTESFSQYLEQPAHLYQITYQELRSLVLQYPYCQNLRYLLARKSQFDKHKNFDRNLKMASLYYTDRAMLFEQFNKKRTLHEQSNNYVITADYLELSELGWSGVSDEQSAEPNPRQQSILFEDFESLNELMMKKKDHTPDKKPPLPFDLPISKDRIMFIEDLIGDEDAEVLEEETISKAEDGVQESGTADLSLEITNEEQVKINPQPVPKSSFSSWLKKYPSPQLSIKYKPDSGEQIEKDIVEEEQPRPIVTQKAASKPKREPMSSMKPLIKDDELVTETLADLLAEQGNFQKAKAMYEKLSLIFPEKSAFFAEQIQKLKNS